MNTCQICQPSADLEFFLRRRSKSQILINLTMKLLSALTVRKATGTRTAPPLSPLSRISTSSCYCEGATSSCYCEGETHTNFHPARLPPSPDRGGLRCSHQRGRSSTPWRFWKSAAGVTLRKISALPAHLFFFSSLFFFFHLPGR